MSVLPSRSDVEPRLRPARWKAWLAARRENVKQWLESKRKPAVELKSAEALSFRDAFLQELASVAYRRSIMLKPGDGEAASAGVKELRDRTPRDDGLDVPRGPRARLRLISKAELELVGNGDDGGGEPPPASDERAMTARTRTPRPYLEGEPVRGADALNLTGLCLSGGGIRSASVCLGVMQALDSLTPPRDASVINRLDYLSAVSGGNYLATSVVCGMQQHPPRGAVWPPSFPYESKTDGSETPETQHLRNYSSFLAPFGARDYAIDMLLVVRGLVTNIFLILPALLILSWLYVSILPRADLLLTPSATLARSPWPASLGPYVMTPVTGGVLLIWLLWPMLWPRRSRPPLTLRDTEARNIILAALGGVLLFFFVWESQAIVLYAMFAPPPETAATPFIVRLVSAVHGLFAPLHAVTDAPRWARIAESFDAILARPKLPAPGEASEIEKIIGVVSRSLGQSGAVLGSAVLTLALFGQKLIKVVQSTLGDKTWAGLSKRATAFGLLLLLGLSVPLLLWALWLNLTYWAFDGGERAPLWLSENFQWLRRVIETGAGPVATIYLVAGIVLGFFAFRMTPNGNSLHQLYRDRLSRAFLLERDSLWSTASKAQAGANEVGSGDGNRWTFSSLRPRPEAEKEEKEDEDKFYPAAAAPYLLVNTAVNLQSSYLSLRGRKADVFTLGPLSCGSHATGYAKTTDMEMADVNLSLAAGMAISGAAASANMGGRTIKLITFSLCALNIRLGYWAPNPARLEVPKQKPDQKDREKKEPPLRLNSGRAPFWFWRELIGWVTNKSVKVHLTDGGHIENLGLYELLKRRCRVIIAVDAEADPALVFSSLARVQMMSRIDHGVRIFLPWPAIATASKEAATAMSAGDRPPKCERGPHVAVGRIVYREKDPTDRDPKDVYGVLIYIKSSLSGDENDLIRDYQRRNPSFPHETTLNQFFSEEQFEAYRALGFHMTRGFFSGGDAAAVFDPGADQREGFIADVGAALTSIGVPAEMAARVLDRAREEWKRADETRDAKASPGPADARRRARFALRRLRRAGRP